MEIPFNLYYEKSETEPKEKRFAFRSIPKIYILDLYRRTFDRDCRLIRLALSQQGTDLK